MNLLLALHSELLKLMRTIALHLVVLAPTLVVLLMSFAFFVAPHLTRKAWFLLERPVLSTWAFLMMPLYITLETALLAGLDYPRNQWKSLLTRPVPRWTLYVAKLMVVIVMTATSTAALLGSILIAGTILPMLRSDLIFGVPLPLGAMALECAQVATLSSLALTIQHWVSLRWRSFSVAVGVGIVAMVLGGFAFLIAQQVGGWLPYIPWELPLLPLSEHSHNLGAVLLIATAAGLVIAAAGCWDFCRREVN